MGEFSPILFNGRAYSRGHAALKSLGGRVLKRASATAPHKGRSDARGVNALGRLIAISNRIPKPNERYSAGGLAVAVRNALERQGGIWLGWSGEVSESSDGTP